MYILQGIGIRRQVFAHVYTYTHTTTYANTTHRLPAQTRSSTSPKEREGWGGGVSERARGRSQAREDDQSDHDCPGFFLDSFSLFFLFAIA